MKCFRLWFGDKKDETKTPKNVSAPTSYSAVTSHEFPVELDLQNTIVNRADSLGRSPFRIMSQKSSNLRMFTFSELKLATKNFSRSVSIGEGGFGRVYKGVIKSAENPDAKLDVAIKKLGKRGVQARLFFLISLGTRASCTKRILEQPRRHNGHKEWVTEVNVLGVVDHPNLVKLIGYCAEDDERGMQRLLIYEYMPNGSVDNHLSAHSTTVLPWSMRLKIAQDAARGLTYLHEGMEFQIIFRDFKSSNILLDEQWNAKLSDFGLARQGPLEGLTHVSTAVVGTLGYAAPEYIQTGRLTSKNDVWSYGVFLYELITGRRPLDRNRPKSEQKLLEWVRPYLSDAKKFQQIIDPRLEGKYSQKSVQKLAIVANRCLVRNPKSRAKMSEVMEMVNKVMESSETGSPKPPIRNPSSLEDNKHKGKRGNMGLRRMLGP
ncbi:Protein kinase domain, partial [Dillenia turbinata]